MDAPSLFDWCEPNYVVSDHVAEFYNTVTNTPYCIIGLVTALCLPSHAAFLRLRIAGLALLFIGLGSMAFHGTLTRGGQAADELAIVYWEALCCFVVLAPRLEHIGSAVQVVALVLLMLAETALYSLMDVYPTLGWALYHPMHVSVSVATVALLWSASDAKSALWIKRGLLLIAIAFVAWLLDLFACESTQYLHLHAFGWHTFSAAAIACMHCALACHVCRVENIADASVLGFLQFGRRRVAVRKSD